MWKSNTKLHKAKGSIVLQKLHEYKMKSVAFRLIIQQSLVPHLAKSPTQNSHYGQDLETESTPR